MQDMDSIRPFSRTWNIKVSVTFDSNNKLDDEFITKLVFLHCKSIFYLSIRFKAFVDPFKAFLLCNDIYNYCEKKGSNPEGYTQEHLIDLQSMIS